MRVNPVDRGVADCPDKVRRWAESFPATVVKDALRLAFVAPRYADGRAVGGAETLLRSLAEHAGAMGHRVEFLTTCATDHLSWRNDRPPGTVIRRGLKIHFFPVDESRDPETFIRLQERIVREGGLSAADEQLWYRHNIHSPDLYEFLEARSGEIDGIIVGPYLFGLSLELARRLPDRVLLVPCLHDEPFARLSPVAEMFRRVRGCLFNSEPERDLARRLFGIPMKRGPVVGMGLDPFEGDPGRFSRRHGLKNMYVIYSGRREPLKGTPLLLDYLEAFRQRQGIPLELVLTGSGEVPPPADGGSWVRDFGVLSEEEKHDAMAGALVFCHPSALESLGIVILESWLASTPVLVNARSEVLRHHCMRSGGGLWFRNYPEFEEELLYLLNRPRVREVLAERGRRYVLENYSWRAVEQRLQGALQSLLDRG